MLIGPDELSPDRAVGIDFRPGVVETLLLAGDETAAPAIAPSSNSCRPTPTGVAIIEVPSPLDFLEVRAPSGRRGALARPRATTRSCTATDSCRWCVTGSRATARSAVGLAAGSVDAGAAAAALAAAEQADLADAPLWDVPEGRSLDGDCYAWLAGEASAITTLRRFLVREAGLDRRQVAFMGYWRIAAAPNSSDRADRGRTGCRAPPNAPAVEPTGTRDRRTAEPSRRPWALAASSDSSRCSSRCESRARRPASIPFELVAASLTSPDPGDPDHNVVRELRVPRAVDGLLAGTALGLGGMLHPGRTRNPSPTPACSA